MIRELLASATILLATSALSAEQYDNIPAQFFKEFSEKKYADSIDTLLKYQKIAPATDSFELKRNFIGSVNTLGDYRYNELITKREIGTRYVVLYYIIGMDKKPMSMRLSLYKPSNEWIIKSFNFDSDVDKMPDPASM